MTKVNGFTLVELLTTIALAGILISVGIPSLTNWVIRSKATTLQYSLLHSINYARVQGIGRQTTTTLCPGTTQCESEWGSEIIIFSDLDNDGILDESEQLLKKVNLGDYSGDLQWRSFRRKDYLQFNSQGLSRALNGTIHYCYSKFGNDYGFAIALSRTGRARIHKEPKC